MDFIGGIGEMPFAALNMIRLKPFYPGQCGIAGSDVPLGVKAQDGAITLYVDSANPLANDNNDGTDPEYPKATVQSAVDSPFLTDYSRILVHGPVTENVVTPDYTDVASYVKIIGIGGTRYSPAWDGALHTLPCLDLRCVGWQISGFRFYGQASAASIELHHTDLGGNDIAIRTIIDHCYFDGLTTGRYGILSHGCYDVWVAYNTFALWHNAVGGGGAGMIVTTTPLAIPYRNYVMGNLFSDSDNGCIWPSNGSFFWNNMFQPVGYAYPMTQVLNTSLVANPGDDNVVWGNTFPGDYSIAGGYRPGAADEWLGNWASDVAEAEVGDNGLTIARPT